MANLTDTGDKLIKDADQHPNSDRTEIIHRQATAQDHWEGLCKRHGDKTSAVGELASLVGNFGDDVKGVSEQVDGVMVSPESLQGGEKKLDRLLQDVAAMTTYLEELEGKLQFVEEDLGAENFHPTRVSNDFLL